MPPAIHKRIHVSAVGRGFACCPTARGTPPANVARPAALMPARKSRRDMEFMMRLLSLMRVSALPLRSRALRAGDPSLGWATDHIHSTRRNLQMAPFSDFISPQSLDAIRIEGGVNTHNRDSFDHRLSDQQAVERVFVV